MSISTEGSHEVSVPTVLERSTFKILAGMWTPTTGHIISKRPDERLSVCVKNHFDYERAVDVVIMEMKALTLKGKKMLSTWRRFLSKWSPYVDSEFAELDGWRKWHLNLLQKSKYFRTFIIKPWASCNGDKWFLALFDKRMSFFGWADNGLIFNHYS